MPICRTVTEVVFVLLNALCYPLLAQEPPVIAPGHPALLPERLVPFEADYEQTGFPFRARLVRTGGSRPVLSFQMIMEGPQGVGIDHVGHYADNLAFAYRRFEFGGFRREYIDAYADSVTLRLRRMTLPVNDSARVSEWSTTLDSGVFDGTFAYWLIAALPLATDYTWRFRTWLPQPDSADVRPTPAFTVIGRESITTKQNETWDCWVVSVVSRGTEFRMWVADRAPYLIRQSAGREGQDLSPVIELVRLLGDR